MQVLRAATRETDAEHLSLSFTPAEVMGAALTSVLTGASFTAPDTRSAGRVEEERRALELLNPLEQLAAYAAADKGNTVADLPVPRTAKANIRVIGSRGGIRGDGGLAEAKGEEDVASRAATSVGKSEASATADPLSLHGLLSTGSGGYLRAADALAAAKPEVEVVNEAGFVPAGGSDITQPAILRELAKAIRGRSLPANLRVTLWRSALTSEAAIKAVAFQLQETVAERNMESASKTVLGDLIRRSTVLAYAEELQSYRRPSIVARTAEVLNCYYTYCNDHAANYVQLVLPLLTAFPHLQGSDPQLVAMLHTVVSRCAKGLGTQKLGAPAALQILELVAAVDVELADFIRRCLSGGADIGVSVEHPPPLLTGEPLRVAAWQLFSPWLESALVTSLRQDAWLFVWDQLILHDGWQTPEMFLRICAALVVTIRDSIMKVRTVTGLQKAIALLPKRLYTRQVRDAVCEHVLTPTYGELPHVARRRRQAGHDELFPPPPGSASPARVPTPDIVFGRPETSESAPTSSRGAASAVGIAFSVSGVGGSLGVAAMDAQLRGAEPPKPRKSPASGSNSSARRRPSLSVQVDSPAHAPPRVRRRSMAAALKGAEGLLAASKAAAESPGAVESKPGDPTQTQPQKSAAGDGAASRASSTGSSKPGAERSRAASPVSGAGS